MTDTFGSEIVVYSAINVSENPIGRIWETTERTLDTRAVVRDGDTLVVGGLVNTKNNVTDGKVPFLGSIPLLGRLFSYKDNQVVKENLVIMITPTILDGDTPETGYESKSEEKAEEMAAKGTDYFYVDGESKVEGLKGEGQPALETEEQPPEVGLSAGALAKEEDQPEEESQPADDSRKLKPLFG